MIMSFIDDMRTQGYAVESICAVLTRQGCRVAARTCRSWNTGLVSARDLSDAYLINDIWDAFHVRDEQTGAWVLTPESLYGRRKVVAWLRANGRPGVAACTAARCLQLMGHRGVRRARTVRTTVPARDGHRAGDLLNRNFTAVAPNRVWVTDYTYVRTWAGVRVRGVHFGRVFEAHCGLARVDVEGHGIGDDTIADGLVAA